MLEVDNSPQIVQTSVLMVEQVGGERPVLGIASMLTMEAMSILR
jgi:hypothetical protein